MGDKLLAKVFYKGTLNGTTHTNPKTGNTHTFAGPNVPTKLYDMDDVDYYSTKNHFKVVIEEDLIKGVEVPEDIKKPEEDPEPVKDEADSGEEKESEDEKSEEPEKPEKDASKSEPEDKPKAKGGNK